MHKYLIKLITYFILLFAAVSGSYSQSSFKTVLDKDSVYRYNTVLNSIDSLLSADYSRMKFTDTSFDNSFGKAEVIDLDRMVYFALINYPELKSMNYKIESDKLFAEQKDYLPDPMFEFMLDNIMTNFKQVGMVNFYLSQMFPYPGKLSLQRKSVLDKSDMMNYDLQNMAVNLINMVKMNYYDLYFVVQKLEINHEDQLIMQNFMTAAEARYSVGKGMQQEVFKSQIELSRLQNEEYTLKQQKKNIFSELTRLTKVVINENTKISFRNISVDYLLDKDHFKFEGINTDELVKYAFENRPDLKSLESKKVMNKTDLEIAKLSKMPDFSVRAGYKILPYQPKNAFTVMLGVSIPFAPWTSGKYDYSIQKSEINIKSTDEEIADMKNNIRNDVVNSVNSLLSAKQTVSYYYNVMIPQTQNSLKATQYNYENGKTPFIDLLDSYRMYQDAKLMFYGSVTMYLKMISNVEKATGMNFKNQNNTK